MAPSCHSCTVLDLTCDLGLPYCTQCTSACTPCSYAATAQFGSTCSTLSLSPPSAPPTPAWEVLSLLRPLSLVPDASPFELRGLAHFLAGVSPTLVALETRENPNYGYLGMSLNSPSKALYHALVAAGGAHARNWGLAVTAAEVSREERKALVLLEADLVQLARQLRDRSTGDGELAAAVNSILAVLQTLILLASTAGDVKLWRRHLKGAASLIEQVTRASPGRQPLVLDTFLLETIRYIDMQAALALNCGTSIPHSLSESGWDASQVLVTADVTGMHGFSRDYLSAASRISDLSHALSTSTPPPYTPTDIYISLESTRTKLAALESDESFRTALRARLSLASHAEQLDGHFRFADCCYFACHVYLARTVAGGKELGEDGRGMVYSGLDALGKVPWEGSAGNLLGWVLVIIGAELSDDEPARGLVRLRMRALGALGHRNLEQCAELLEEVWTRADARTEGAEREGWQATMVDLGWDLLVA